MDPYVPQRNTSAGTPYQPGAPGIGRHARPAVAAPAAMPDLPLDRRTAERIAAIERSIGDSHSKLQASGIDPEALNIALSGSRECLKLAVEVALDGRQELLSLHHEWEANRRRQGAGQYAETAALVVPDAAGMNLCPDPSIARTHEEFMDALRRYYIWAGKPSYRVMSGKCSRFAASTIHSALKGNKLPRLEMVQAIIASCGGTNEHRNAFATAWRRLALPQQEAAHPSRRRGLYPVSETA